MNMNHLTVETEDTFASSLELAANNDIEGFKQSIERDPSSIDEPGPWYGRQKGSKQMALENRTPLMVAAAYGSVDVLKLILSLSAVDVNFPCGHDKSTALHCAASGGSLNIVDVVKLLLIAGADPNVLDAHGQRPGDVIIVPPNLQVMKFTLEELLLTCNPFDECNLRLLASTSYSDSPPLSSSPENGSPSSVSDFTASPPNLKLNEPPTTYEPEKKEYPIDPSFPDIKNSIYSTDEFRMYSFKVRPCSRAYSHDWTECPFVHPGENARRRDPRKCHYSCVPCPEFRKGTCRRGDSCEYAHGVFECWLHPAQYRTRLCKDGTNCNRRVCFFAHTSEELRPLYISTGSAVPAPRSARGMDYAAAMSLLPSSPSSPFTLPMSPSASGISHSSMAWPQLNIPSLHLPGSNLQSSRLRSSLCARDLQAEDYSISIPHQGMNSSSPSQPAWPKTPPPSNLDDLFLNESLSPRFADQSLYSPTHKSALLSQLQQQKTRLSPINTSLSPKSTDHPLLRSSYSVPSSGRMSPRNVELVSLMGSWATFMAQHGKQQEFGSLSSCNLGLNVPSAGSWGSNNEKVDWSVDEIQPGKLRRSSSFELGHNGDEPDLSWVQSLVRESPAELKEKPVGGSSLSSRPESADHALLGAWPEQMKLDQLKAG